MSRCVEEAAVLFHLLVSVYRFFTNVHDTPVSSSLGSPHREHSSSPSSDGQKSSDTSATEVAATLSDTSSSLLTKTNLSLHDSVEMERRGPRPSQSPSPSGCDTTLIPTTDPRFPRLALENGILPYNPSTPPRNFEDIKAFLEQDRKSPGPGQTEFTTYQQQVATAPGEAGVKSALQDNVLQRRKYGVDKIEHDQQFSRFPSNVGFNNGLSAATPDWVEGYFKNYIDQTPTFQSLGDSAVPTAVTFPIVLAHLVGEFKKLGGNLATGSQQAAYAAACLVHGRDLASLSMQKGIEPGMAYVGSFVSDGHYLRISVHYTTEDPISQATQYRQYVVFDANVQQDYEHFELGYRMLRNLQDWTQQNAGMLMMVPKHDGQAIASPKKRKIPDRVCKSKAPIKRPALRSRDDRV